MKFDYHVHSYFSFDAVENGSSPEELCQAAIDRGLSGIAITDHYEISAPGEDANFNDNMTYDPVAHRKAVAAAKRKYRGKLDVLYGVELGSPSHAPQTAIDFIDEYGYEFVIISSHRVMGIEDFWCVDYPRTSDHDLMIYWKQYLEELQEDVSLGIGDTVAHLGYPLRYYRQAGREDILEMQTRYREYYTPLLKTIIRRKIPLEINYSGLRGSYGDTLPSKQVLSLYEELGGVLYTHGSDAHVWTDVGIFE